MTDFEMNEDIVELDLEEMEEVDGGKFSGKNFIRTTGNVHVRKGAGTNTKIMGVLPSGTIVSYLRVTKKDKRGVAWYKINYNGSEGWVSSQYAKFKTL